MSKYLKAFETTTEYNTYISRDDRILPNVSLCKEENDVHYNPFKPIIAKFNVTSTSNPTVIMGSSVASQFSEIAIDGVVQPNVIESYMFGTIGEHTVRYALVDTTTIGNDAFNGCRNLISVTIPNGVTSIGEWAFRDCYSMTSVTIPNSVISIGEYAFCGSGLISATIPNGVTIISKSLFSLCANLTSVTISNSATSIGVNTFYRCSSLTSITIPNSVTSIGGSAFAGCSGLTSVTIGNGVTSIVGGAFDGCTNLETITSLATTAPTITNSTFTAVKTGGTLYVPIGSSGYDVWMGTSGYYLGYYNWTKVEQ